MTNEILKTAFKKLTQFGVFELGLMLLRVRVVCKAEKFVSNPVVLCSVCTHRQGQKHRTHKRQHMLLQIVVHSDDPACLDWGPNFKDDRRCDSPRSG